MEVKDRILVESGQLFAKYGIRSMTMDALAEEMGISKRTIYERFPDKDTLLIEVIKFYKKESGRQVDDIIETSDNAIEALFRIIRSTIRQLVQLNPSFFHDIKRYHNKVFKEIAHPGAIRDYSVTRRLLEKGMEQGVFRDDINLIIVNRTLHTLFDLFSQDSPLVEAGFDRKDLFDHSIIPFFRGISTPEGQQMLEDCKDILEDPIIE